MRIFYASDVHGNEVCWRKFLNAAQFYRVDALIMGGDIVGKAVVPIVAISGSSGRARWRGRDEVLEGAESLAEFEKAVRAAGFYPARVSQDEEAELATNEGLRGALFERVVRLELARWIDIAEEKAVTDLPVYVIAGNDDPWFVDTLLESTSALIYCDARTVVVGDHPMISLSYANPTPWNSHRELPEDELFRRIDALAARLEDPHGAIFNLHVPPYASGLDDAPLLDSDLRPRARLGQVEVGPVGSHAVRDVIEVYQPMVGLHGHIHESRGIRTLGRTVVINPGSEYTSGRIHGAVLETKGNSLKRRQLVIG